MREPRARVIVTVDVEEDDWASYAPTGASTRNVAELPELCDRLARYGARPTFFVNRPPLVAAPSAKLLRGLTEDGACEIATHCHPWNTPPLAGPGGDEASMMHRLDPGLNRAKIAEVHRLIGSELGVVPTAFRAGRWSFGPSVADALVALGYRVDASVTPLMDWTELGGPDHARAPMGPYRFHPRDPWSPAADGPLLEIPPSLGFLRGEPRRMLRLRRAIALGPLRHTRILGVLGRFGILARRWLCPETSTRAEMVALVRVLLRRRAPLLVLTFHSSALLPGATPYVRDARDRERFLRSVEAVLAACAAEGVAPATLGEAAAPWAPAAPPVPERV